MLPLNKSYKNRKVSLTIYCKYKYFDSTVQRAEDRRQKFYFCRLPFAVNVKLNLSIVGRNMLRAFDHRVAMCCDMLGVVGSNLKMVKFEPTTPNMSQHGGQTHATCCAQQCCDMLRWHVAIVWSGLYELL